MHIHMYICMYTYIHTYIHTYTPIGALGGQLRAAARQLRAPGLSGVEVYTYIYIYIYIYTSVRTRAVLVDA